MREQQRSFGEDAPEVAVRLRQRAHAGERRQHNSLVSESTPRSKTGSSTLVVLSKALAVVGGRHAAEAGTSNT